MWPYTADGNAQALSFFGNLKKGLELGKPFPIKCPYEVGLVHNPVDDLLFVAILAMRGTSGDDSMDTGNRLKNWFIDCGNPGEPFFETYPVRGSIRMSLAAMSPPHYEVLEILGMNAQGASFHEGNSSTKSVKTKKPHKWWEIWRS